MQIETVDPRTANVEDYHPVFQVRDWYSPDEQSLPTAEISYEFTDASIWDVLKWVREPRTPAPAVSYLWVMYPYPHGGRTRICIGALEHGDGHRVEVLHGYLPEPDTDKGLAYFIHTYSGDGPA